MSAAFVKGQEAPHFGCKEDSSINLVTSEVITVTPRQLRTQHDTAIRPFIRDSVLAKADMSLLIWNNFHYSFHAFCSWNSTFVLGAAQVTFTLPGSLLGDPFWGPLLAVSEWMSVEIVGLPWAQSAVHYKETVHKLILKLQSLNEGQ